MARQYLRRNRWPKLHRVARIPDDPVKMSNTIGTISFAAAGPNSRTTLLFINFKDNSRLDQEGFAPFGTVVGAAGMATAVAIHNPTPSAQHPHPVPTAERYDSGLPCIRLRVWLSTRGSCRNQIIRRASTRNSTKTVETAGSDRNIQA
jgi:cyclophilin family peptidyl-prolyl cis-trans isomerase